MITSALFIGSVNIIYKLLYANYKIMYGLFYWATAKKKKNLFPDTQNDRSRPHKRPASVVSPDSTHIKRTQLYDKWREIRPVEVEWLVLDLVQKEVPLLVYSGTK